MKKIFQTKLNLGILTTKHHLCSHNCPDQTLLLFQQLLEEFHRLQGKICGEKKSYLNKLLKSKWSMNRTHLNDCKM